MFERFSVSPFDPEINFEIAEYYEQQKQIASAVSFYLRTIEYGIETHRPYVYLSLLRLAKCFDGQNDRTHTVTNAILQALAYEPKRPEAYFWMSRFHERLGNWQECYTFATLGLFADQNPEPLPADCEFTSYCLLYEKAVSAWWLNRAEESRNLFHFLETLDLSPEYADSVRFNLAIL